MRDKTFFIICVSVLFFCVAGYFIATDRIAIADRTVESSYKQFLLKASSHIKGRIIIAGGSSSMHGIDAGMMERHFGRLAINIADNATYPLEHKTSNLGNYVTGEDLIILPLEWEHYMAVQFVLGARLLRSGGERKLVVLQASNWGSALVPHEAPGDVTE